jgi:Rap1a immunity proteins
MNKWILSACLLAVTAAPVAASDVRLESYRHPKNAAFRSFNQVYLDGVRSGLIAYNVRITRLGGQPAFCLPGDLAMTTEQTEDIMLRSADKRSAKGDTLIALLLLAGLQDTFPCEKTGSR